MQSYHDHASWQINIIPSSPDECYAESSATALPSPISHYTSQPLSARQSISFPYEILFRNSLVSDWEVLLCSDSEAAVRVSGAAETVYYFG